MTDHAIQLEIIRILGEGNPKRHAEACGRDYLNDSNACRWMLKVLTQDQREEYVRQFSIMYDQDDSGVEPFDFFCLTADARKHCRAFLLTFNRWVDSEVA